MKKPDDILQYLNQQRSFDFSGYRASMLERRIHKRLLATGCKNYDEYIEYLNQHNDELDNMIDVFTINVSHFFRNSLTFEYIRKIVLPDIISDKSKDPDASLRIWSAGCSFGEEPYSMAMIVDDTLQRETFSIDVNIFGTDIDKKALKKAAIGTYGSNSIKNTKYNYIEKYFTQAENQFNVDPKIKSMVRFSFHDLLGKNDTVPSDSIFGGFDVVLCRNVLIYFEPEFQIRIFNKLYKSLKPNGYLVLGESEVPIESFRYKFKRECNICKIYRKID